jgi:hypothetical protein
VDVTVVLYQDATSRAVPCRARARIEQNFREAREPACQPALHNHIETFTYTTCIKSFLILLTMKGWRIILRRTMPSSCGGCDLRRICRYRSGHRSKGLNGSSTGSTIFCRETFRESSLNHSHSWLLGSFAERFFLVK